MTYGIPKFVIHHPLALVSVLPGQNSRPVQSGLNVDVGMSTAQSVASTAGSASTTSHSRLETGHEAQAAPLISVAAPSPQISGPSRLTAERFTSTAASILPNQQIPYTAVASTTTYASSQVKQSEHADQQIPQAVATTAVAVAPMQAVTAKPASDVADHAPFQTVNLQTTNVNLLVTSQNDAGLRATATITSDIVFHGTANPILSLSQTLKNGGDVLVSPLTIVTDNPAESAPGKSVAIIFQATSTNEAGSIIMLPSTIFVTSPTASPTVVNMAGQTIAVNPTGFQIDGHSIVPGAQGFTISGTPISLGMSGQLQVGSQTIALTTATPYSTTEVLVSVTLTDSAGKTYTTASTSDLVYESIPKAGDAIPPGAYTTALVEGTVRTDAKDSVYTSSITTSVLVIPTGVANPPNPISGSILVPLTTTDSSGHTYTTTSTSDMVFEPLPTPGASTPSQAFTTLITEAVVRTDVSGQLYMSSLTFSVLALPTGNSGNSSSSGIGGAIISGFTPSSAGSRVRVNSWIYLLRMTVATGFGTLLIRL